MKLSAGKVGFPIEFDNGDTGVIYFNPNDRSIRERINGFDESIKERVDKINLEKYKTRFADGATIGAGLADPSKMFEMSPEELTQMRESLVALSDMEMEYNSAVKDELDNIFGSKISDVVFRYCQPFDTVVVEDDSGNEKRILYIEHFVYWLADALKKHSEKNSSAVDRHLSKYIKK